MKRLFSRLWKSEAINPNNLAEAELLHSCAGRAVNVLNFIIMIIFLGLWIMSFILIMDNRFGKPLPAFNLGNLYCIIFFGGMILAILMGGLAGNFLKRIFWSWLIRRSMK